MCGAPAHEQGLQLRAFTGYLLVSYNQLDYLMNAITASKNLDGCSARSVVSASAFSNSIVVLALLFTPTRSNNRRDWPAGPVRRNQRARKNDAGQRVHWQVTSHRPCPSPSEGPAPGPGPGPGARRRCRPRGPPAGRALGLRVGGTRQLEFWCKLEHDSWPICTWKLKHLAREWRDSEVRSALLCSQRCSSAPLLAQTKLTVVKL